MADNVNHAEGRREDELREEDRGAEISPVEARQGRGWRSWPMLVVLVVSTALAAAALGTLYLMSVL